MLTGRRVMLHHSGLGSCFINFQFFLPLTYFYLPPFLILASGRISGGDNNRSFRGGEGLESGTEGDDKITQ